MSNSNSWEEIRLRYAVGIRHELERRAENNYYGLNIIDRREKELEKEIISKENKVNYVDWHLSTLYQWLKNCNSWFDNFECMSSFFSYELDDKRNSDDDLDSFHSLLQKTTFFVKKS